MTTVSCLLSNANLSPSSLGRKTKGSAKVKNKIKAVDRLLGNNKLYAEKNSIYKVLAEKTIGQMIDLDIVVDWSSAGNNKFHILRASIVFDERAVTLYQEVHPEQLLGNYKVHKSFLNNLKSIIPTDCNVNIITDAGFQTDWYALVQSQGWDFTGRVLIRMNYKLDHEDDWQLCSTLYQKATNIPTYIGHAILTTERKLQCHIYLYSEKLNHEILRKAGIIKPKKKRRKQGPAKRAARCKKSYETPWLLVTSKNHGSNSANKMVKKYSRRMKIEHDFRSTKNSQTGLGYNIYSKRDIKPNIRRLAILLLLAALAVKAKT